MTGLAVGAALLFKLCIAHAVCDYPLQGDFLAKAKHPIAGIPGVPWGIAMLAHALIHAGGVWLITGSGLLAAIELGLHTAIDVAKCDGKTSFGADQGLHLCTKLVYVACLLPM